VTAPLRSRLGTISRARYGVCLVKRQLTEVGKENAISFRAATVRERSRPSFIYRSKRNEAHLDCGGVVSKLDCRMRDNLGT
jgi:hypothetical protein